MAKLTYLNRKGNDDSTAFVWQQVLELEGLGRFKMGDGIAYPRRSFILNHHINDKGTSMARGIFEKLFDEPLAINALSIVTLSAGVCFSWNQPRFHPVLYILAGTHFGMMTRELICRKFHTKKAMQDLSERAWREVLLHIDAQRIAAGLKPLAEILHDDPNY